MKISLHQIKILNVLSALTRFTDFIFLVSVSTLLGIISSNGSLVWQFWLVLVANWLSVGFANLRSSITEAPKDVLEEPKIYPNPIAEGRISPGKAQLGAILFGILALCSFIFLGWKVAIFGVMGLLLGWLYSRKGFQFKAIPFIGLLSNTVIVVGIPFLTAFFTFHDQVNQNWLFPFLLMLCLNLYLDLFVELQELRTPSAAQIKTTAMILGVKTCRIVMLLILSTGIICGLVTFIFLDMIPLWVVILLILLVLIYLLPILIRIRQTRHLPSAQTPLHVPILKAATIALFMQFLIPWLLDLYANLKG
jgi:4-hydroxybenzoate polyprenyltransferase